MSGQWFLNFDVWNSDKVTSGVDVLVEEGKVTRLEPHKPDRDVPKGMPHIGALPGQVLMPLGVDLQVHLRVPGQDHKETADTGLKAARKGAIGAVLTMPNTNPVIDNPKVLQDAQSKTEAWEKLWGVKVLWSVAMTKGQAGAEVVDALALKKAGAVALTDDGIGVAKDEVMDRVFAEAEKADLPCLQHAEVPGHGAALAEGPLQKELGLKAYPPEAEWKMVKRDLLLLEKHPKVRYHVLHASCAQTVQLVAHAKKKGLKATCEVTPHHLFYSSESIIKGNTNFKMNPPLRNAQEQGALVKALAEGMIDFVATDHAPHESSLKGDDFEASAFGTTGLESSLRVLITLYQRGQLSPTRLVEVFSTAPAKFYGLEREGYGRIQEGMPFKAAIVDVKAPPRTFSDQELVSKSHNSCFVGASLAGELFETYV